MSKIKDAVEDAALLLFAVALIFLGTAQAAGNTKSPQKSESVPGQRVLERMPTGFTPSFFYVEIGGDKAACTKLAIQYDDGSEGHWEGLCAPGGKWEKPMAELGKEMDKVQREHDRISKERKK